MISVDNEATGRFVVTTTSGSTYLLDLDKRILCRIAAPGFGHGLRQDGQSINLVEVVRCRLGEPMLLLIDLNLPNVVVTTRESTPITRIEPMLEATGEP